MDFKVYSTLIILSDLISGSSKMLWYCTVPFDLQSDLPATVRVVQERMLDVLKENIRQKAKHEKEKKNLKHYKKVKFFGKLQDFPFILSYSDLV